MNEGLFYSSSEDTAENEYKNSDSSFDTVRWKVMCSVPMGLCPRIVDPS